METFWQDIEKEFSIDKKSQVARFKDSFRASLNSSTTFLPSNLDVLPRGDEEGEFLAIDLGGSNLRCAIIRLMANTVPIIVVMETWTVPTEYKVGLAHDLFEWVATCISLVIRRQKSCETWKMGVSFSFPVDETSIDEGGLIMDMGKAYHLTFSRPEGRNLRQLLQSALAKTGIAVDVVVCVNDACATLLTRVHLDPRARMSLILGTGCNAALYMPDKDLYQESTMTHDESKHRFVNCELSLLGRDVFPYNTYDAVINAYECNRGFQPIEYATTGPWLGEIVRLVFLDYILLCAFMDGVVPSSLDLPMSLLTDTLWRIEGHERLEESRDLLDQQHPLRLGSWTLNQVAIVRRISILVSTRAADLIAICLLALKSLLSNEDQAQIINVGYCGSIIENYPNYYVRVQKTLDSLQANIQLMSNTDSGILGAAIGAACLATRP